MTFSNEPPAEIPLIWVAYYSDMSAIAVFDNELAALRYALDRQMDKVRGYPSGSEVAR